MTLKHNAFYEALERGDIDLPAVFREMDRQDNDPFEIMKRAVASLPDCNCTVLIECEDGTEKRIVRTKNVSRET